MIVDAFIVSLALLFAYFLRFEMVIPAKEWTNISFFLPWGILILLTSFVTFRVYATIWRYTSVPDLWTIGKAVTVAFTGLAAVDYFTPNSTIPRSVMIMAWFFTTAGIGASRLGWRIYCEMITGQKIHRNGTIQRTLIVGAGDGGVMVARELFQAPSSLKPIGFIDDDPIKKGKSILGLKVLGTTKEIESIVESEGIKEIIIAMPSVPGAVVREIVEQCKKTGARLQILPALHELMSGKVSVNHLRNVEVEDLLRREPVKTDINQIAGYLKGKKVLITGAGGSIGSELCRQALRVNPKEIILIGQGENSIHNIEQELRSLLSSDTNGQVYGKNSHAYDQYSQTNNKESCIIHSYIVDIKNQQTVNKIFAEHQPEVVFHAAAHKHVPLMEKQPEEAVKNNAWGTKILAQLAVEHKVERFVMISTDKAVNPTNAMGASKRFAEIIVQHYAKHNKSYHGKSQTGLTPSQEKGNTIITESQAQAQFQSQAQSLSESQTRFAVVRFGNVLGSRGSVIPIFKKQIAQGGPVTVTHPEMIRYFMTIPEAVTLVLQAGALSEGGEIFVLDMGTPVKITDLATDLIRLSGLTPGKDIKIEYSGIRPGEKLYEELSHSGENLEKTEHNRIMRIAQCAKAYEGSYEPIEKLLEMREESMYHLSRQEAIQWLEGVNPTYHHQSTTATISKAELKKPDKVIALQPDEGEWSSKKSGKKGAFAV
ncbi:polysaccharide biosynthesis protein [Heliorestis acidaminivorans]|uniref:Polysaccharide biosynthesis protein n=2 Tax=Heliorestis acidaminivorans TaxID=553427 RepID=A0A6I0F950_9FIRM|nr:polysaccharide biosynthesis protein [Heliorestis acidaminivorans]